MRRLRVILSVALAIAVVPVAASAQPKAAAPLPGQAGGDPAPDAQSAAAAVKSGKYEDAITYARRSLQRDERYVPALIAMAKAYYFLKKYEFAAAIIDLAQKLDANNAEAVYLLGFIAIARNDTISATQAFKRATELKDDFGIAWMNLCSEYVQSKNYEAAVEAGAKAVQYLGGLDKAHLCYGAALRGKMQYPEAERELRRALELNPNYAPAYFNLGIMYLDAAPGRIGNNMDVTTKLNTAIEHLAKYKNLASFNLSKDDPVDGYIEEAKKGIDREQKRLQRLEKQKERDTAKGAQPGTAPAPAPAPPPPQ